MGWLVTKIGVTMNHDILKSAVEEACNKLAEEGTNGCDTKEVVLACFGMLMFNGIDSLKKTVNRAVWKVVGVGTSILVAIILTLIFI